MDMVSSGPYKKKRKYEKLSLDQKVQIIRAAEMGYSQRTLASQYNCGKTQIHLLVTQKDMWLAKWERSRKNDSFSRFHSSTSSVSAINSLVWDFYKKACLNDIIVTGPMLQERAQQISDSLHVTNFVSNPGWLEKFMEEFNIKIPVIPCVSNARKSDPSFLEESPSIVNNGFEKSNIYCLGTVELKYRNLPCLSRKCQSRLTVCFALNACGEKSIESLVFSENSCVEGELWNVNVPCFSSPEGQVTIEVYQHSLNMLNEKMAQENRKILLFVGGIQFPEDVEREMSHIEIQKWDQGAQYVELCNKFKLLYCQRLLTSLGTTTNSWDDLDHELSSVPVWKLMRIVQSAWNLVPSDDVVCIFRTDITNLQDDDFSDSIKQTLQEISDLINILKSLGHNNAEEECNYALQIAQDILEMGFEEDESINEEDCSNAIQHDPILPLAETEAIPSLIRLEMLIQTLTEGSKRQKAMDLLDQLERTVEDLLMEKKACGSNCEVVS